MNAIDFVKQNGIERTKQIVELFQLSTLISIDGVGVSISDLRQIVNAFELVERNNGLNASKNTLKLLQSSIDIGLCHSINDVDTKTEIPKLKQAIELVEKCDEI